MNNCPENLCDELGALEEKIFSAQKHRLLLESELCSMKREGMADAEELKLVEEEIACKDSALEKGVKEMAELTSQLNKVQMCSRMEAQKNAARLDTMEQHRQQFLDLNFAERRHAEQRLRERQDHEEEEREKETARILEQGRKRREKAEAAAAVRAECEQLEQECAVLVKRNNAILLLLRKNLFDAETKRRNMAAQQ